MNYDPRLKKIFSWSFCGVLLALYGVWLFITPALQPAGILAALVNVSLFAWAGIATIPKALDALFYQNLPSRPTLPLRESRREVMHPLFKLAVFALLSRIAIMALAYAFDVWSNGYQGGIFDRLDDIFLRTDAPHYLGIAENWYTTVGDPRFHIVFFPLYPLLMRIPMALTGNTLLSAFIVSNAAFIGAVIMLYELVLIDHGQKAALRSVRYICIIPAGFFFGAPMTESVFLLLSLACFYFLRREKLLWAGIMGALAAFTRSPGIILMLPLGMECVRRIIKVIRDGGGRLPSNKIKSILGWVGCVLMVSLGLLAYLWVNYSVTGDPFTFATYQKEHWSQGLGFFFSTASYQTVNALNTFSAGDYVKFLGLWLPNILAMLCGIILFATTAKRMDGRIGAYFLGYYAITCGATWLLSAPRYLAAGVALPISLAILGEKRYLDYTLSVLCIILGCLYLLAFVSGYPIY